MKLQPDPDRANGCARNGTDVADNLYIRQDKQNRNVHADDKRGVTV